MDPCYLFSLIKFCFRYIAQSLSFNTEQCRSYHVHRLMRYPKQRHTQKQFPSVKITKLCLPIDVIPHDVVIYSKI